MMRKILCKRRCYGFRRRLWEAGATTDIGDNEPCPAHFVIVSGIPAAPIQKPVAQRVVDPMAPRPIEFGKPVYPDGGMAAGLKNVVAEPMPTAGSERKKAEDIEREYEEAKVKFMEKNTVTEQPVVREKRKYVRRVNRSE